VSTVLNDFELPLITAIRILLQVAVITVVEGKLVGFFCLVSYIFLAEGGGMPRGLEMRQPLAGVGALVIPFLR
jgi:hypothetical protein